MNNDVSQSDQQAINMHLYQSIAGAMLSNANGNLDQMTPDQAADIIYDYYSAILSRYYKKPVKPVVNKHKKVEQ
jgi:hypothetical protein